MQYRVDPKSGNRISALGLGCMRFPGAPGRPDAKAADAIISRAVERGINYLDTAYLYPGNEACVGASLERLGLRDRVLLATKLPHASCKSAEDFDRYFDEQLRRLRGGKISMVLQNPMSCFDPLYRIGEQMAETLQEHTALKGRPLQKRMEDILRLMRIHDPADVLRKYPHQLSGGMLQRVMIGLAICMQPSLIIADEPTTAIDSISQYAIMQEFLRIKQRGEVSMIFISHDLGVLSLIADRLIVMHDGKAVESGTAQEIFDNATDTYTRHLIKQHRAVMHRFLDALHAPVPGRIPA